MTHRWEGPWGACNWPSWHWKCATRGGDRRRSCSTDSPPRIEAALVIAHDVGSAAAQILVADRPRSPGLPDETIRSLLEPYAGDEGGSRLIRAARALDPRETASRLPALAAARVPALVLWGESDRYLPVDAVARPLARLLTAELRVLPGGHFLPAEAPRAVAAEIIAFAKTL